MINLFLRFFKTRRELRNENMRLSEKNKELEKELAFRKRLGESYWNTIETLLDVNRNLSDITNK